MFRVLARVIPAYWIIEAVLHALWELVVEDVQLAVGTVLALVLSGLLGLAGGPGLRAYSGWTLLVLLVVLIFVNLYSAGRRAQRHVSY